MVERRAPALAVGSTETEQNGTVLTYRAVTDEYGYQKGNSPSSMGKGNGKDEPGEGKDKWFPYY